LTIAAARHDGTGVRQIAALTPRSFVPTARFGRTNVAVAIGEVHDGPILSHTPESDRIVVVDRRIPSNEREASYTVTAWGVNGDTAWRRSIPYMPQRLRASMIDSVHAGMVERYSKPFADSVVAALPRYGSPVVDMVVGAGGIVWVGERTDSPDRISRRLLDAQGVDRVRVTLDSRHKVVAARGEELWTVSLDADDVPLLNRFRVAVPR
jgi:hypothetical protein